MAIKYKYSIDNFNKICDIDDITLYNDKTIQYNCIACGDIMIPKIGKGLRQKHFAHKINKTCSGETYLHLLAKKMFKDEYLKCLNNKTEFFIELMQISECNFCGKVCYSDEAESEKYDLIKSYNKIEIEVSDGPFKPDILLTNGLNKEKIYIEFNVTHACDETKIDSDNRIIEIKLYEESDLNFIKNHLITHENSLVLFYNFKNKKSKKCFNKKKFFLYYPSNRAIVKELLIQEKISILKDNPNVYVHEFDEKYNYYSNNNLYLVGHQKIFKEKKLKNCGACKYLSRNSNLNCEYYKTNGFCFITKKEIQYYGEGINCINFNSYINSPDQKHRSVNLNEN